METYNKGRVPPHAPTIFERVFARSIISLQLHAVLATTFVSARDSEAELITAAIVRAAGVSSWKRNEEKAVTI